MSDWETAPNKVTESNLKTYMDFDENGNIRGAAPENADSNLAELQKELDNPKLSQYARQVLVQEKQRLMANSNSGDSGWEKAPDSPSKSKSTSNTTSNDGWESAPQKESKSLNLDDALSNLDARSRIQMKGVVGTGETALNFVSGIPGALGGGLTFLGTLAGTGGDIPAASHIKEETEKAINDKIQYEPRSDFGKQGTKLVQEGFKNVIDAGGKVAPELVKSVPLIGEDLHNRIEEDHPGAMEAVGKALTEMGLDVAPLPGMKGMKGKGDVAISKAMDAASKLESLSKETMPPEVNTPSPDGGTMAHADDFAATNPYDLGGHVSEAEAGRPSTIDNAQGDLFGGKILEDAQHAPDLGSESIGQPKFDMADPQGLNQATMASKAIEENRAKANAEEPLANTSVKDAYEKATRDKAFKETERIAQEAKDQHYQQLEQQAIANRAGELDYLHAKDALGDKTLMAQDKTIMMRGLMRINDLRGALGMIVDNHPLAMYRDLAQFFQDRIGGLKIELDPAARMEHGDRSVTGLYNANTHTIRLSGLGATSPHTILHEISHSLTSMFMQARPNDIRVMGLKDLFNRMSDRGMQKQFPGIVNPREFVAEAFSNPKFQEYLKKQNYDNRSVFRKFTDGVKQLIGITPKLASAFDHTIDLGKQVMDLSDGPTRANMMEQFKGAGVPNKLADMMASKPTDLPTTTADRKAGLQQMVKKLPGLEHAVSDFAFYDKPMEEIIKDAVNSPDIPTGIVEKFAQQMQGGALFESLKTRNPVIKATYEKITRATQEAAHKIKTNITDKSTGIKEYMRALSSTEKGEIHAAMMLHEGDRVLSSSELAEAGFNERQIAYYNKYRELNDQFFKSINERRVSLGMEPMDARIAHVAGRFMGDFSRMVYRMETLKDGTTTKKVVGRISGNTRGELNKATEYMQKEHPEWNFDKEDYNKLGGKGYKPGDRFTGMMEALNFLSGMDKDVSSLLESYKGFLQNDAVSFLNATRHAKDKVKDAGGIIGSEGHKEWLSNEKNAEEGMKAQLSYFEQGYEWEAMTKAVADLKPLLGDEGVLAQTPRAVEYAKQYIEHAQGRNQGPAAELANWTLNMLGETTGIGHTNMLKFNGNVKHLVMQKFMGLFNIPFSITQLSQPLQTQPAMLGLLRSRGLEFSTLQGQLKATNTYLHALLEEGGMSKLDAFEKAAMKYADEMNIFDVKMSDHTKDINASAFKESFDRIADLNITVPEKLTRGMTFLAYAHILRDAGIPAKDVFGAAENMTNLSMVNYHKIERPMGYAKLGWLGDVASTLTRYKHNQWSQLAFYAREGGREASYVPLAKFLTTSVAFGGLMGFFAFQEADAIYQLIAEHVFKKPDTLTNQALKAPEVLSHGVMSTIGLDMTSRFSNANAIPNSIPEALMPYGSGVLDTIQSTGRWVIDPTNEFKFKQMVKGLAPQAAQGIAENMMFTNKEKNGKNLYINSTVGPNEGKGRVERTDNDMLLRAVGFRDIKESKELAKNYSDSQIAKQHSNIADNILQGTKEDILGNKATAATIQADVKKAASHGMDPTQFTNELVKWSEDRQLTQAQQILLREANGGFKGAFKFKESQR